jgi:hypothetical protein
MGRVHQRQSSPHSNSTVALPSTSLAAAASIKPSIHRTVSIITGGKAWNRVSYLCGLGGPGLAATGITCSGLPDRGEEVAVRGQYQAGKLWHKKVSWDLALQLNQTAPRGM